METKSAHEIQIVQGLGLLLIYSNTTFSSPSPYANKMNIDHDVPTILATLRLEADPELMPLFYTMEDLWERKYAPSF